MSQTNIIDLLKGTLQEIQNQQNNNTSKQQESSIFDFIKGKLAEVDQKTQTNIQDKEGKNVGILDILLDKLNSAQKQNREDPNVPTAPDSIFDRLKDQVNQQKQRRNQWQNRRAEESITDIIQQYNLDVRGIDQRTLQQIQTQYVRDNDELDRKYAQYLHNLIHQRR